MLSPGCAALDSGTEDTASDEEDGEDEEDAEDEEDEDAGSEVFGAGSSSVVLEISSGVDDEGVGLGSGVVSGSSG